MNPTRQWTLAALAGLGLFGLGAWLGYAPVPAAAPATARAPARPGVDQPAPVAAAPTPGASPATALANCKQRAELCDELRAAHHDRLLGPALDWPVDLKPLFREDAIHTALDAIDAECPEAGVDQAYLDCDEYPCLLWTKGGLDQQMDLYQCPAWPWKFRTPDAPAETEGGIGGADNYTVTVLAARGSLDPSIQRRLRTRIRFDYSIAADQWNEQPPLPP